MNLPHEIFKSLLRMEQNHLAGHCSKYFSYCPMQKQVRLLLVESFTQAAASTQHHWIIEFSPAFQHGGRCNSASQVRKQSLREQWQVKDTLHSAKLGLSSKPRASKAHPLLAVSGILSLSSLLEGAGLQGWLTVLEPSHKEPYEPCVLFSNLIKHLTRNFKCLHCCWHTEVLRIQFGVFQK